MSPLLYFAAFAAAGVVLPAIAFCVKLPHAVALTMTGFVLAMFLSGGFVVFALADGLRQQEAFDRSARSGAGTGSAGFLAGFCISGWALTTGLLMPVLGKLFDRGHYEASLWGIACVPPLGVACWFFLQRPETQADEIRSGSLRVDSYL